MKTELTTKELLDGLPGADLAQKAARIQYYGQCLSSEMPASVLAAYWRGRRDGMWK